MKSILTFQKWTKKMSKIDLSKKSLLRKFFIILINFYGVKLNDIKIFYCHIFFKKIVESFSISYIWKH